MIHESLFTQKAVSYFLLASTLLALGLFFQDTQLAVLVLPLASLFFLENVWGLPEKVELQLIRRIVPRESFGDEEIHVESLISNRASANLYNVEIHEFLPAGLAPQKGTSHLHTSLGPLQSIELTMEFSNPGRGHYTIGPSIVRVQDPFGLYLVEKMLEPETIVIMPKPEKIRIAELRPRHLGPWPGTIPSKTLGQGTEFYSLRGYVGGDDPKRINWKASARHQRLIINETEAERVTDVMLVLDTDVSVFESSETELFERGIGATASMARFLLTQGNRVGLIMQGEERGVVPPAFGKRHERKILFLLAAAKPGRSVLSISYVVTVLARLMLPAQSQIIIISPLLDPTIMEGIEQLAIEGYSVLILSPSAKDPGRFASEFEEVAYRMLMLERSNTLLSLEKMCTVIQWPSEIPLSAKFSRVKRVRPHVRI